MRGARGLAAAVLLCLVGAFVVLVAAGRLWSSVDVQTGPISGVRQVSVTGAELAGGVRALGLVGLAGVVALAATRRTGRLAVGVLLALTGAGVVAAVLGTDLPGATLRSGRLDGAGRVQGGVETTAWPWVTVLGGALLAFAGLLTVLRGRSWPGLGQRYEAPIAQAAAPPPSTPAQAERALWEALDRGEDPTAR